jgi:hypothetical protein
LIFFCGHHIIIPAPLAPIEQDGGIVKIDPTPASLPRNSRASLLQKNEAAAAVINVL